jgi:hypothetical protein
LLRRVDGNQSIDDVKEELLDAIRQGAAILA